MFACVLNNYLPVGQYLFKENKKGEKTSLLTLWGWVFDHQAELFIKAFKIQEPFENDVLNSLKINSLQCDPKSYIKNIKCKQNY